MSSSSPFQPTSSVSVSNILTLLASHNARLVAGAGGLKHQVTWSCRMRARLPAFESVHGGEFAMLALSQLRRLDETLPHLLQSLHQAGVSAVAVAAPSLEALDNEACVVADQLSLPLILLPPSAPLEEIEREVITIAVSFRGEIERKATEVSHQLMQLSIQGAGIQGVCEHLARGHHSWVVVEDAEHHIHFQAAPSDADTDLLLSSDPLTDEQLQQQGFTRILAPILIRHETVGYLSLIGNTGEFDVLERLILGQVAPILALEFARERERSAVESRYQIEAFMDVLQGHYQQAEEMLARARLLGYDLTKPQTVVLFEIDSLEALEERERGQFQPWSKRVREEVLRVWPSSWILSETRRITALLPFARGESSNDTDSEQAIFIRLERVQTRLDSGNRAHSYSYSGGIGRVAEHLRSIPQSLREAQQALEIGRKLFGNGKLHSFARLGIYRLLFYLDGQNELIEFYQEALGPLLHADTRGDNTLLETLESFFRCNGNLSETARLMHLHRNSLLYRLGRIEEILDHSLEDAEFRLSLQIALKIHHLRREQKK
ncbi:MAG: helix-turn-helix domain-containing protein [Chloroflexota bacterium]|nr:helix-turn-helix domain-containing protein [Chloroflexota bacterium]